MCSSRESTFESDCIIKRENSKENIPEEKILNFGSKIWTENFEMSESIEDLRNENFRLKLRKGSHWQTNEIACFFNDNPS